MIVTTSESIEMRGCWNDHMIVTTSESIEMRGAVGTTI